MRMYMPNRVSSEYTTIEKAQYETPQCNMNASHNEIEE